jgi:uncharacterized Zn finger protein (UPF0148 family)
MIRETLSAVLTVIGIMALLLGELILGRERCPHCGSPSPGDYQCPHCGRLPS